MKSGVGCCVVASGAIFRLELSLIEPTTMTRPLIHERETSFDIVVEETVVASAQCLEEALFLFGVAHYVFNQKVSRASRSTMWFIVHDIMGLPAESTATADALKNLSVLTA